MRLSWGLLFRAIPTIANRIGSRLRIRYFAIAYPRVRFGAAIFLGRRSQVKATGGGEIVVAEGVAISDDCVILAKRGRVVLGKDCFVGRGCVLVSVSEICIGAKVLIGEYVTIRDQDHEFEGDGLTAESGLRVSAVRIGDNVWIGAKATITRGVRIGDNAVVGANAVVTRDVPENVVVGGVPAKVIRFTKAGEPRTSGSSSETSAQDYKMRTTVVRRLVSPVRRHPALFKALRAVFHPGRALYQHLHFIGPVKVQVSDYASFMINHYGFQLENDLFWAGFGRGYQGTELRLWRALVQSAEFIADVGANTGIFSLAAAALNPRARIVAIEPVVRVYKRLTANIALNSFDICALQIAASDANGEAILFDTEYEHIYSASLDASMLEGHDIRRVSVRAARLDDVFCDLGWPRIDLLKIDVEKHEGAVLAGMQQHVAKDRPMLLIEILNREIGAAVSKSVADYGYRFFAIDEREGLVETPGLDRFGVQNYLLCAEERWRLIGGRLIDELDGTRKRADDT